MKQKSRAAIRSCSVLLLALPALEATADYGLTRERLAAVDTSKWACKFCPDETATQGHVSVYGGYSGEDASSVRFKNSKAEAEGIQGEVDAQLRQKNDSGTLGFETAHLGSENSQTRIDFDGDAGTSAELDYRRSTRYTDPNGMSIYPDADNNHVLPPAWVDQTNTGAMSFDSLHEVKAYRQRDTLAAGVAQEFGPDGLTLSAAYRQVDRDGRLWRSGSILNDITALTEKRDDKTRELNVAASLPFSLSSGVLAGQGSAGLEFFQSEYENSEKSLNWENPFIAAINGANQGRMATAPDNEFQRWRALANYRQGAHQWTASFGKGQGEQNEAFLPYTVNGLIATSALPKANYGGEVETTHIRLGWDYILSPAWQLNARYRFNERENSSETLSFDPVLTDSLALASVSNDVYSHKKSQLDLGVDWKLRARTRLSYDIEYETFERERESAGGADTLTLIFGWREKWNADLTSTFKLLGSDRKQDDTAVVLVPNQNPYFSEFTTADRLRDGVKFNLDWRASRDLLVSTEAAFQRDDYDNTLVGVTGAEDKTLGFSADWTLAPMLSTHLSWQRNWMLWRMNGSAAASFPTWSSEQSDQFDTLILGLRRDGLLDKKLVLGLDYVIVSANGKTRFDTLTQYSDQKDRGQSILGYLDYQWRPQWQLRFETLYERYTSTNPMLIGLDTLPHMIGNAVQDDNDSEWLFGVRVRYLIQ